jgi:hypothetical protein
MPSMTVEPFTSAVLVANVDRVSSLGVIHEEPTLLARGRATVSALIKLRLCSFFLTPSVPFLLTSAVLFTETHVRFTALIRAVEAKAITAAKRPQIPSGEGGSGAVVFH